jgi:hypothetical protein
MFDDLAVIIRPEDVDASPIALIRPLLIAMQDDVIPFGDRALEMHALSGILLRYPRKVRDKRLSSDSSCAFGWLSV